MQLPHELSSGEFQGVLDSQPAGESIECLPLEYGGPLHFRKSVFVDGRGATFWRLHGPVVLVESAGVTLRHLRIEVTADAPCTGSDQDVALIVTPGLDVMLEDVEVRGGVRGLKTEEGIWHYPYALHIGTMLPGVDYEFLLRLIVPVQCQITSQVSGIDVSPSILAPGKNELKLKVSSLFRDTLICGSLHLRTALLKRRIAISGRVLALAGPSADATASDGSLLWEPSNWDIPQAPPQKSDVGDLRGSTGSLSNGSLAEGLISPQEQLAAEKSTLRAPQVAVPGEHLSLPQSPTSTRIRRQSTPLSKAWSTPGESKSVGDRDTGGFPLSPAFQEALPIPSKPVLSDMASVSQAVGAIGRSKSKPISIGIFGPKDLSEVRTAHDPGSDQKPGVGSESNDTAASTTCRKVPKPVGPSVPSIFLKP